MGHGVWALALVFGCLGLSLLVLSLCARSARGLGFGETAALDDVTLFSKRYRLTGRPDRIVKHGKFFIPEEWKSSKKVEPWHLVQLGVYFILIEDHYGVRPPHGFIVLQGGRRERVKNTQELRERVLAVAAEIRERRGRLEEEIQVSPARWQCRVCGQRNLCQVKRAQTRASGCRLRASIVVSGYKA